MAKKTAVYRCPMTDDWENPDGRTRAEVEADMARAKADEADRKKEKAVRARRRAAALRKLEKAIAAYAPFVS